jgi:hypothetical protein
MVPAHPVLVLVVVAATPVVMAATRVSAQREAGEEDDCDDEDCAGDNRNPQRDQGEPARPLGRGWRSGRDGCRFSPWFWCWFWCFSHGAIMPSQSRADASF